MDKCRYFCVRKLFCFIILFHSFDLTFFLFAIEKKGLCDPTLPFVKTIGPEVYKGEISIMLVSKVTIAIEAWVFAVLPGMLIYLFP